MLLKADELDVDEPSVHPCLANTSFMVFQHRAPPPPDRG
jgi:hypothetical protein